MFTSRAEYRLSLRADNADRRLTRRAHDQLGCISAARMQQLESSEAALEAAYQSLESILLSCSEWIKRGFPMALNGQKYTAGQILARSDVDNGLERLKGLFPELQAIPAHLDPCISSEFKYAYYLHQQDKDIESLRRDEQLSLVGVDFSTVPQLTVEEYQSLSRFQPASIAAASRISGIRASSLVSLLKYVKRSARASRDEARPVATRPSMAKILSDSS